MKNSSEKTDIETKELKKPSKKAVQKIEETIENIKNADNETVKRAVKKAANKVAIAAEKVEKELKSKKNEFLDEKKKNQENHKRLSHNVKSKKSLYIEYSSKQISEELIYDKLIDKLKESNFQEVIKTLNIYYKVEEETAYCVINHGEPIVLRIFD